MDLRATIRVDDRSVLQGLVMALRRGGCQIDALRRDGVDFVFPWAAADAVGSLLEAWQEVVFFVRSWAIDHPHVLCEIENVRLVPSDDRVPQATAA